MSRSRRLVSLPARLRDGLSSVRTCTYPWQSEESRAPAGELPSSHWRGPVAAIGEKLRTVSFRSHANETDTTSLQAPENSARSSYKRSCVGVFSTGSSVTPPFSGHICYYIFPASKDHSRRAKKKANMFDLFPLDFPLSPPDFTPRDATLQPELAQYRQSPATFHV